VFHPHVFSGELPVNFFLSLISLLAPSVCLCSKFLGGRDPPAGSSIWEKSRFQEGKDVSVNGDEQKTH